MSDIITELSGSILRVQLNRPAKKNAMASAMYISLADVLNTAAKDEHIRVVLWHGAGDSFCAGNDVEDFLKNPPGPGESPQAKLMHALLNFERACLTALRPVSIWTVARISTSVLKRPASDCDKPFCFRDITKRPSG
jgi:enoyl-CoA hydratase/carnithine racemase